MFLVCSFNSYYVYIMFLLQWQWILMVTMKISKYIPSKLNLVNSQPSSFFNFCLSFVFIVNISICMSFLIAFNCEFWIMEIQISFIPSIMKLSFHILSCESSQYQIKLLLLFCCKYNIHHSYSHILVQEQFLVFSS